MFSHLSKLPVPRLADWNVWNMSICIALICNDRKAIVSAFDMKATLADFSADYAALKGRRIYRKWYALYAGNDVEHAPAIIRQASAILGPDDAKPFKPTRSVVAALEDAYWELIHKQIESRVLRKYKFTVDSFRETGSKKCTATVYNSLCAKIEKLEVSLDFLLYGFDEGGDPHIYVVNGKDAPRCYDEIGVWAIGSGAHAALSSLAFHIDKKELDNHRSRIEEGIYFACEAKYMAESSGHVGKDATIVAVDTPDDSEMVGVVVSETDTTAPIKAIWRAEGAPRVPPNICERIREIIAKQNPKQSAAQTSEPKQ